MEQKGIRVRQNHSHSALSPQHPTANSLAGSRWEQWGGDARGAAMQREGSLREKRPLRGTAGGKRGWEKDWMQQRTEWGACYLPTWGCKRRRLSVGLGTASVQVTGWLRARLPGFWGWMPPRVQPSRSRPLGMFSKYLWHRESLGGVSWPLYTKAARLSFSSRNLGSSGAQTAQIFQPPCLCPRCSLCQALPKALSTQAYPGHLP